MAGSQSQDSAPSLGQLAGAPLVALARANGALKRVSASALVDGSDVRLRLPDGGAIQVPLRALRPAIQWAIDDAEVRFSYRNRAFGGQQGRRVLVGSVSGRGRTRGPAKVVLRVTAARLPEGQARIRDRLSHRIGVNSD